MSYLDALVNSLFKKSESGATLFYPWGIIGKGYVVSSASEHSRYTIRPEGILRSHVPGHGN